MINDIIRQFKNNIDGLPEKPQILESSFFRTTNAMEPSFCGVTALEVEGHAAALTEKLKWWNADAEFIGIAPIYQPAGDADVE